MKKLTKILNLVLALSLLLVAACGKNDEIPAQSNEVTVYSPLFPDAINSVVDGFTNKTGIKVNLVVAGTGELLKRIQAESENPLGDVIFGGGAESLNSYKEYFTPYQTANHDKINPLFKDSKDKWFGFAVLPMVMIYNTDLVTKEDAPTSWNDLIDPKWKGEIAMASPVKSGSSYTITATLLTAFGKNSEAGFDFIKKFVTNLDGKILGGSSAVPKGVVDKEYSIGLTLESSAVKYKNAGGHIEIVYPSEGTSVVADGAALIKGSENQENAKLFLDYVGSKEVQEILATKFNIRGVRTDVALPKGLGPISDIKLLDYDFDWASNSKKDIVKRWKNIVSGKE
ncbi:MULTISPECIES: ABC transporter substrate-binding protein [Psychrilyobacter]|uniref:Extracellular solute-binding protein n=1 Tax=Psychrilyobacter piezotolerans TaxID=2293438 RepID=A0ABX9KEF2_9FUSO|nr:MULTISPECIES: ABC transporter substrate-binding protein [Psychrilyobacter]MCS5421315.1 ABC transporter substrate-binding protein [Psychrilyobacter sp. S5]NDI78337.1 extracellular solute-binding protein [Psychrilyobacter piezotolerans]RDE59684.1 extracellular solute-binding protein [Psychrilyobacter sp. S5]REI40060.1 extracellular solute-binding protein [Psychrilyobacter piezotolerans]